MSGLCLLKLPGGRIKFVYNAHLMTSYVVGGCKVGIHRIHEKYYYEAKGSPENICQIILCNLCSDNHYYSVSNGVNLIHILLKLNFLFSPLISTD